MKSNNSNRVRRFSLRTFLGVLTVLAALSIVTASIAIAPEDKKLTRDEGEIMLSVGSGSSVGVGELQSIVGFDDETGVYWKQTGELDVFSESLMDGKRAILPGSSGSFDISVSNLDDFETVYTIILTDINDYHIPLQFKMCDSEGEWLYGSEKSAVKLGKKDLHFSSTRTLSSVKGETIDTDTYTVYWEWPYSPNWLGGDYDRADAAVGNAAKNEYREAGEYVVKYTLNLKVVAKAEARCVDEKQRERLDALINASGSDAVSDSTVAGDSDSDGFFDSCGADGSTASDGAADADATGSGSQGGCAGGCGSCSCYCDDCGDCGDCGSCGGLFTPGGTLLSSLALTLIILIRRKLKLG